MAGDKKTCFGCHFRLIIRIFGHSSYKIDPKCVAVKRGQVFVHHTLATTVSVYTCYITRNTLLLLQSPRLPCVSSKYCSGGFIVRTTTRLSPLPNNRFACGVLRFSCSLLYTKELPENSILLPVNNFGSNYLQLSVCSKGLSETKLRKFGQASFGTSCFCIA